MQPGPGPSGRAGVMIRWMRRTGIWNAHGSSHFDLLVTSTQQVTICRSPRTLGFGIRTQDSVYQGFAGGVVSLWCTSDAAGWSMRVAFCVGCFYMLTATQNETGCAEADCIRAATSKHHVHQNVRGI